MPSNASPRRSRHGSSASASASASASISATAAADNNNNIEEELDHLLSDAETRCLESPQTFAQHSTSHARVAVYSLLAGIVLGSALLLVVPPSFLERSDLLPAASSNSISGAQQDDGHGHGHEHTREFDFDAAATEENRERYFAQPNVIVGGGGDNAAAHDVKQKQKQKQKQQTAHASGEKGELKSGVSAGKVAQENDGLHEEATKSIHPQCIDRSLLQQSSSSLDPLDQNRPLLLLKYARTGSTWLVWSGNTLRLRSGGQQMVWTSEAEGCGEPYTDELMSWWEEYYNPTDRDVRLQLNNREHYDNPKCPLTGKTYVDYVTKGLRGHERKHDRKTDIGSFVSTIDWKISVREGDGGDDGELLTVLDWQTDDPYHREGDNVLGKDVPDLTLDQWEHLFTAVPNLALGVLVRTNSVKRAISRLASEEQVRICGGKKLRGDEECLQNLPEKLYINTTLLFEDIVLNDMKRTVLPEMVAQLSSKFGDGTMVCISYESMQRDIAGEMELLGQYLGDDIDPESLETLRQNAGKTSYKRGSDDLQEYLANYDEVRESLAEYPCLIEQLEDSGQDGKDFPPCNLWRR